jgi:hypothetical protein
LQLPKYDGKCYTNSSGYYTKTEELDYPSEQDVLKALRAKGIAVIFALKSDGNSELVKTYKNFVKTLKPQASIDLLQNDLSNIASLIEDQYNKLNSKVSVFVDKAGLKDNVEIKFFSTCNTDKEKETRECNVPASGEITFRVEINLKACGKLTPKRSPPPQTIKIKADQSSEYAPVSINLLCPYPN